MGFNINGIAKFVNIAKSMTNPKQAIDTALNALASKNPELANELRQNKNNPIPVFKKYIQNGTITKDKFNTFKGLYGMAKKLGLKINVSDKDWQTLEKEFDNTSNLTESQFRGF